MKDIQDLPKSPYVGLIPYTEEDAPFFFGRKEERDKIIFNLRGSHLTVLIGPSGAGKSSLLSAGVVYKLQKISNERLEEYGLPEFSVVVFRDWSGNVKSKLIQEVEKAITKALQIAVIDPVPPDALNEMLKTYVSYSGLQLLIILDQFEEIFSSASFETANTSFIAELTEAINDLNLNADFLLSLRDDALWKLTNLKTKIPYLFDNMLVLEHMNVENAREAIEEPLKVFNKRLEPEQPKYRIDEDLTKEILKQLTNSDSDLEKSEMPNKVIEIKPEE